MLMALTAIAALGMAPPVRAGGGSFYATVTNVTQLIADINYADTSGGTFMINLQPNTNFVGGLPVIGGTKTVNLTIIGNGDTIDGANQSRLFVVNPGSSLTLDQVTLQNGYIYAYNGGAIYNSGTLVISNCTFSGNLSYFDGYDSYHLGGKGGAIYNNGGTVIISDSFLSGNNAWGNEDQCEGGAICNDSGTVKISNSTISGNGAYGDGGGIYNNGTVTVENSSSITGNGAADVYNLGTLYLDGTSTIGVLDGYSAIGVSPVLSINSWSSTAHQLVLSWSTNYTGFTLQSSTDPGSTNWTDGASPTVSGASFVVTNSMSAGAQFFRLKR